MSATTGPPAPTTATMTGIQSATSHLTSRLKNLLGRLQKRLRFLDRHLHHRSHTGRDGGFPDRPATENGRGREDRTSVIDERGDSTKSKSFHGLRFQIGEGLEGEFNGGGRFITAHITDVPRFSIPARLHLPGEPVFEHRGQERVGAHHPGEALA